MDKKKEVPSKEIVELGIAMAGMALRPLGRNAIIVVDAGDKIAFGTIGKFSPDNPECCSFDFKVIAGFIAAHDYYTEEEQATLFDITLAAMKRGVAEISAKKLNEQQKSKEADNG